MKKFLSLSAATLAAVSVLSLTACQEPPSEKTGTADIATAFPSTYSPQHKGSFVITNAHIVDGIGGEWTNAHIRVEDGKIVSIEDADTALATPADEIIDAQGGWVTPGLIDIHSHLGNYPSPGVRAHGDGNEAVSPNTADVYAEHGVWPQDPGFDEALAGGVTTLHILPGSANLFGGRGVTMRNVPSRTVQGMKFPDAPYTLKMACGENPKRVYGQKGGPASRMGNVAGYRKEWIKAAEYKKKIDAGENVTRDLKLETLAGVLSGDILVQMHCYRADEMVQILDIAKEFDYKVTTFHHAIEAYKIGDILKENGTCAAMWADWWGFKMEANDTIRENIPFVHAQGACAMIHSDSETGIQRLNQEVAKAWADGEKVNLGISKADAWAWVTSNPAKALGIADETGSLEAGKRADIVLWDRDPFSVYARPQKVFIDGDLYYDVDAKLKPRSDFLLGSDLLDSDSFNSDGGQ